MLQLNKKLGLRAAVVVDEELLELLQGASVCCRVHDAMLDVERGAIEVKGSRTFNEGLL